MMMMLMVSYGGLVLTFRQWTSGFVWLESHLLWLVWNPICLDLGFGWSLRFGKNLWWYWCSKGKTQSPNSPTQNWNHSEYQETQEVLNEQGRQLYIGLHSGLGIADGVFCFCYTEHEIGLYMLCGLPILNIGMYQSQKALGNSNCEFWWAFGKRWRKYYDIGNE